jgi:hypothetical protein
MKAWHRFGWLCGERTLPYSVSSSSYDIAGSAYHDIVDDVYEV